VVWRGEADEGFTMEGLAATIVDEGWIRAPLRWFDREFAPALGDRRVRGIHSTPTVAMP
jgi:hypothetical protein